MNSTIDVSGSVDPTATTQTTTTKTQSFNSPPPPPTTPPARRRSFIVPLLGLAIIGVLLYSIATKFPKDFNSCRTFPASRILETYPLQCRTFYGGTFTQAVFAPLDDSFGFDSPSTSPGTATEEVATSSPSLALTPSSISDDSTKGGLPVFTPTSPPAAASPKPTSAPKTTNVTPIPTQNPTTNSFGDDWVRHSYPDQKIAFYVPKNWKPSNAIRNHSTNLTTIAVSADAVSITIRPNWANLTNIHNLSVNYELNNSVPARKIVDAAYTSVYFERHGQVYNLTCRNDFWATCHSLLKNIVI